VKFTAESTERTERNEEEEVRIQDSRNPCFSGLCALCVSVVKTYGF
jgi:hypothetical protein